MATKSSKIAVTLQPSLKQKLRDYGKDNQIKNFSGVILAILDEYFGEAAPAAVASESESDPDPDSDSANIWVAITAILERLESLEGGTATTSTPNSTPKPKPAAPRRSATKAKSTATKPAAKRSTTKSAAKSTTKSAAKSSTKSSGKGASATKTSAKKPKTTRSTKSTAAKSASKAKSTRSGKAASKTAKKTTTRRKSSKASTADWMSTREAFEIYGGKLSWSRFSKLTPEELKERFNLDSDLSRKVRGSRFNQWLKPGK